MKDECYVHSEAEIAERSERAKKLYRYVNDVARRIDEASASSRSIIDLFSTKIEVQRQKLRDNCEKLMFIDPVNYGKKSLELLWRKVYYETVSLAKKHAETNNEYDNYLFTHFVCGIGHFHHLITRIQLDWRVPFKELDYTSKYTDEDSETTEEIVDHDLQQLGYCLMHSCLIYLGDLSRYQVEIFHTFDTSIAARYYLQAALIDMSSGMPYNQLGNLYVDKNYNLDSAFYYIQCLSSSIPFEGAMGNLIKLFEKNASFVESIENIETLTQSEHVQVTVANFLSLIEVWYFSKDDFEIPQKCNMIAHLLKVSMDLKQPALPDINKNYVEYQQALDEENLNPSYLNSNLIHKIVQVCLFTIAKMNEVDEKKAFACKAFTLALLSQLLKKLQQDLESFGLKNPAGKYLKRSTSTAKNEQEKVEEPNKEVSNDNEIVDQTTADEEVEKPVTDQKHPSQSDEESKKHNGISKANSKKMLAKRRRRRRLAASDSSDGSETDTEPSDLESDQSCTDNELTDSSFDSEEEKTGSQANNDDDIHKDSSNVLHDDCKMNGHSTDTEKTMKVNGDVKENGKITVEQDHSKKGEEKEGLHTEAILHFLTGNNILPSIKLLQDWVLNEKDLIASCGDSGESLFQCLVDLLNILTFYFKPSDSDCTDCPIIEQARMIAKKLKLDYRTIPLPEDANLRGTNICKYDKDAAEWQLLNIYRPSVLEENVIRILMFLDFGDQIAKLVPRIRFNRSMQILYYKKVAATKANAKLSHKRSREWHNSKKSHAESSEGGLLRRLGRLWLTSQVRELERYGRVNMAAPTMLVVDSAALHKHLRRVKQLLKTRIFILLVPTVVLQELDELKREQSTARDAIRWLETQLQAGSRFLRAQRPGQAKPLPLMKYPRKAPQTVHNFIQILEFCHHFVSDEKHLGSGDQDSSQQKSTPLLMMLTGNDPPVEEYKEFSVTGAAQAASVTINYIEDFYSKWRQTTHKSGKKR